ncbi:hypothetical protein MSIM_52680 [Mycobacterium simiae]|nr:hypothetical protein [Mycobacterium simiae]BBX43817.1 hypothetical protein MSIM_52680 [Mycobacterium simiae]
MQGPGRFLPDYEAGLEAALCVTAALFGRLHTDAVLFMVTRDRRVAVNHMLVRAAEQTW